MLLSGISGRFLAGVMMIMIVMVIIIMMMMMLVPILLETKK